MKSLLNLFFAFSLFFTQLASSQAWALGGVTQTEINSRKSPPNGHPYEQMLSVQAGPFKPRSIQFTNWNNNSFNYDSTALNSFMVELGWGIELTKIGGTALSLTPNIGYSAFSLKLPPTLTANPGNVSVSLHMFNIDTRLAQSWQTFPIEWIVPFWEAGYQLSLYNQTSTSDLTAGEGTASNFVAAAGLRFWLNRSASLNSEFPNRYITLPVFLTAKVNRIFSNNAGVDPASTSVLGGVSVGL